MVLPGTASTLRNLATRGLVSGAENAGQSFVLSRIAGEDYNWHDAVRDMAFGATFSTVFGGFIGASRDAHAIQDASRRFQAASEILSAINRGAELTDRGESFYQHVPGLTKTAMPADIAASEFVRVQAMDHSATAGGGEPDLRWLVGRDVQMDGIGDVHVTGIDGREVRGTIDGREVRMDAHGVSINRDTLFEPGQRVRLDDGTLGTIETAVAQSTPFAEATRVPRQGDAEPIIRIKADDGRMVDLKPSEMLLRTGQAVVRRGQVVFDPANSQRAVIAFGTARDASTIGHEPGHVFRRTLREIDGDLAEKMNQHYGQNGDAWTVEGEERWAHDWETYLSEGKAPTKELTGVFERFAQWLADLWESLGRDKTELTDAQRQAFGKLLDNDQTKAINGELGGRYKAVRDQLRQVLGENQGSKSVDALMLANAKAWSRATGRNIDEYFSSVLAGFTDSLRNPFHAPIKKLPPRTIIATMEPPGSRSELGTTPAPNAPAPEAKPTATDAAPLFTDAKPTVNSALVGKDTKIVLGDGRVLPARYAIIDADRLIPSNDARKGFAKNPAGDINERPYHDPTEGKASREKVYAIADKPDTSQIINDAPTSNIGPPIVGPDGVVYGGNARSMGIQLAYSRGGQIAQSLREAAVAAAERFGVEKPLAQGIEHPVLVRMVTAADAGKPGELSRALNEDVATGRTADADAVSRGRLIKPETSSTISNAIGDRSIDEALRDPKTAMQIVKAMREDGAMSDRDLSMFVQGDQINNEGKLTVKRTLLGVVIPDVRTLAETPPSIENVFIRALGPLQRLLQETRGRAADFRVTIDNALQALADYRRGEFETFNQMLNEPPGFTPEPWRDNPSGIALARIISESKPTEVYHLLNKMADDAAEARSGQGMLGMEKPPAIEEVIGRHLGVEVLAQDKTNPNELAQDVLDLSDTIKSEDQNNQIPLGGTKGAGATGGRGVRVGKAPRIDRVGVLKSFDHPLLNVITNLVFRDPLIDSTGKRGNANAEQFSSYQMHTAVDGYMRKMYDHVTAGAKAAGIGKVNVFKRAEFEMKFREQVGRLVRDPNATSQTITDPHLKAAVETTRDTLRRIGQLGKDNFVKNFDKFALDDNYLTRQWAFDKLHAMQKEHTPQEVSNLFQRSVLNARPNLTPAEAKILGDSLIRKLFSYGKEAGIDRSSFAAGLTNREYLLRVLKDQGVDEVAATTIADKVAIDRGNSATLSVAKRRTLLDEKASITTAVGKRIAIEDLLNNDAMAIVHGYGQQVISEAAMTQVRRQLGAKLGLKFDTDAGMMEFLSTDMANAGYSRAEINKALYHLDTGIKRLRGVALDDSGPVNDALHATRQFTATVGNGAFGIPAMFELGHAIVRTGVRASFANMPAMLSAWRAVRAGNTSDPGVRAILYTLGIGHDSISSRYFGSFEHNVDPYQTNPESRWAGVHKVLNGMARFSRMVSGVPQITEFSRLYAANAHQYNIVQQVKTGKMPSARRLAWLGLDQAKWNGIASEVNTHATKSAGGLTDLQLDNWTDMAAKHNVIEAIRSSVDTTIQEGGIGASHPWLETEAGKLIFQFRQFGIMAYNRQTLAQWQIGDSEAIGRGMIAAVPIGMMQYMATTYLNSIGRNDRDEYLQKMLSPGRIAIAAFSRASFTSIGPVAYDTFAASFGMETLGGFRATGLESDPLFGNPTFSLFTAGRQGIGGSIRAFFDPNYDLSDENIRGVRTAVPYSRLPGTSLFWNSILNQTPAHSVKKANQL
jgi:hypothetical protein